MKYFLFILCSILTFGSQAASLSLDTTLGSMVGENATPYGAQLPFHAGLELTQELPLGLSAGATVGHQSSADRNGNEYNGKYYGVIVKKELGKLYGKARFSQFFDNDDEPEGNTVNYFEAGLSDTGFPVRLGVWYQESDNYQAQGVNIGYTFNLAGF